MENGIAITVKGKDLSEVATRMVALGQSLNSMGAQDDATPTPKKGRGKKAKPVEEDLEETVEDTDVEDLSDDEEVEESEEAEEVEEDEDLESDDEEVEVKVDQKQLASLKKALNTYSGKHGKDKAVKILHKFAKVSQDVKADDFGKLMKALKV